MELYELVELVVDVPDENLSRGMIGTIVEIYNNPPGFEVEFADSDGHLIALLGLRPEQIRPAGQATDSNASGT
ncbi:DUF4926 domain-containing protein [Actinopolymorpha pittospori]